MKVHGADQLNRLRDLLSRTRESDALDTAERAKGAHAGAADGSDSVQLSPAAKEMQHLRDLMSETPEVREQLVASLREEISSGRYHFDGTHLADELLRESAVLAMTAGESDGEA
jgi:flagellar biosynthesis anti-sigma factor FlgM